MTRDWSQYVIYLVFDISGLNASQRDAVRDWVGALYADNDSGETLADERQCLDKSGLRLSANGENPPSHVAVTSPITPAMYNALVTAYQALSAPQQARIWGFGLRRSDNTLLRKTPNIALDTGQSYSNRQLLDAVDNNLQLIQEEGP